MEEVLRELSDTELDAVSGGAAAAAATTSGDNALAAANNTGPTTVITTFAAAAFTGAAASYIVLGEVQYPFQPTGIYMSLGPFTLHDSIMMIPRTAAQIQCPGC